MARLQGIAKFTNSLQGLLPDKQKWSGNAVMTQFSDSLVISVEDDRHGRDALNNALFVLTSSLIEFGFLFRGGVAKGDLFHDGSLVFGPAFIDAYELESKTASTPRVILSKELSAEWDGVETSGAEPWIPSTDGYLFFNFLPPFMGNPIFTNGQLWQSRLGPIRGLILKIARDKNCSEAVFAKYVWLASYFDSVCEKYPCCGVEKVLEEAMRLRWKTC